MCTVVTLWRPDHAWPLVLAANRDEMAARPWSPPGRHWPDRPNVVAGLDKLAGGSWLGINDEGVLAAVLNRQGSLGPDSRLRSRGELVLEALDHADGHAAVVALSELNGRSYRPFNMIVADNRDAYWIASRGNGNGEISVQPLPVGVAMLTALDLNDVRSGRIAHFLPLFQAAAAPRPEEEEWSDWQELLGSPEHGSRTDFRDAMRIAADSGFGTLSSALIALPSLASPQRKPVWLFADGPPGDVPFRPVLL